MGETISREPGEVLIKEYLQGWLSFWFDDEKRLRTAKALQHARIDYLRQVWRKDRELKLAGFDAGDSEPQ